MVVIGQWAQFPNLSDQERVLSGLTIYAALSEEVTLMQIDSDNPNPALGIEIW